MMIVKKFQAFLKNEDGSNAIEFAMVAPIFILTIFSIFEVGYVYLTDLTLESALKKSARLIRTGQVKGSGNVGGAAFRQVICDNISAFVDCDDVHVEVDTFANWQDGATLDPLLNGSGQLNNKQIFDTGGKSAIVVIRTTYVYDIMNPFGSISNLSNYGNNQFLHVHIVAFMNEPF